MSFSSLPFLFFCLPLTAAVYFLLPAKKSHRARNVLLLLVSLVFYAWGEPVRILLLLAMIAATHVLGLLAERRKRTKTGKRIVLAAVLLNVGVLFLYKYLDFTLGTISSLIRTELPSLGLSLPLGMSFFAFQSISYVTDIYRGKTPAQKNPLHTALYLSLFMKIASGPIVEYNQFEKQLENRQESLDGFAEGMKRFILGLSKKVLLAANIGYLATEAFSADIASLPVLLAWLGCAAYMLQLYFDFSGYSDMAVGLGKMFGFELPENFRYPYTSTSVTAFWQKWHISLGGWFRDYMFYPLTLGPATRMRKRLLKRGMSKDLSKFFQNVLVVFTIWLTTGLWHGASWNHILWGLINGAFILAEMYKKPLKNKRLDAVLGWGYTLLLCFLTRPLIRTGTFSGAGAYYAVMLGLKGNPLTTDYVAFLLREYHVFLLIGCIACFPVADRLRRMKIWRNKASHSRLAAAAEIAGWLLLLILLVLSIAYLSATGTTIPLYQKF